MTNLDNLLRNVLNPFMKIIIDSLDTEIKSQNNVIYNYILIWFIVETVVILIAYLFIWRPIEFKFASDVINNL